MKITTKLSGLTAAGVALATVQSGAWAQSQLTITYAPYAPVPTMSEWGMLALSVLVAAGALLALRKKGANRTVASIALACALALAAVTGHRVVTDANANPAQCFMTEAGGGSFGCNSGWVAQNTSGVAQQIINISATPTAPTGSPTPNPPIVGPECTVGLVVPDQGLCTAPALIISDRRLKRDVQYLATLEDGVAIYSFKYLQSDDVHVGVMAQDLIASSQYRSAVIPDADGYYSVNYRALGLRMISLAEWNQSSTNIYADSAGNPAVQHVSLLGAP